MRKATEVFSRTFSSISVCWMMALLLGSPRVRAAALVGKRCLPSSIRLASMASNENTDIKGDWKSFKPEDLAGPDRYRLCVSSVVPRPVAVITSISSKDGDGIVNCAPFSYTSIAANDPPIVTHGINLSGGKKKDTLVNIEATGEWVFNVLTTEYLESANSCAAGLAPDLSEIEEFGLGTLPCELVMPPRLAEASVSMECKLIDKKEIFNDAGEHTTTIVMGRVVNFHVHESVLQEGQPDTAPIVDLKKLNAVGRAGGITYWPVGVEGANALAMGRPK